jgi:hypothetical protein
MAMVHVYRKVEHTGAILKVISGERLTKQALRKECYYIKNMHILKLLLNIITTGMVLLVILGMYAFVKEIYRM